jgi:hypothetical protein
MSKYSNWINQNKYNPNKSYCQYWRDDDTFIRYVYDTNTGKGVEEVYFLKDEYEIDKTDEILEDLSLYQE